MCGRVARECRRARLECIGVRVEYVVVLTSDIDTNSQRQ